VHEKVLGKFHENFGKLGLQGAPVHSKIETILLLLLISFVRLETTLLYG
jgi:hypothetical protein